MIIRADGGIVGTIGGGPVEGEVMAAAPDILSSGRFEIRAFHLDSGAAGEMDMICGGRLDVLLERISPDPEVRGIFQTLEEAGRRGRKYLLAADIPEAGHGAIARAVVFADGDIVASDGFPRSVLPALLEKTRKERAPVMVIHDGRRYLAEPAFIPGTAYLFGAGHVSRAVSRLTHLVGFRTVVLDDRAEFASGPRFPRAEEVRVIDDFNEAMAGLPVDPDSYLVILTRGHHHDRTVLQQALGTDAGYIGMIGSRRKRDAIYAVLRDEGMTDADFARVHCPIGIDIEAETPEEIAVSIVAELIAARASRR
ncbi:XdhC family aldehyde oxidoreductase maturation factor, partial [Desulfococcus sp.]|uniref:XdhC family aldehyde oxidoreductase maturation factor n=1 Tax=Desulfococcus sp. TaxID=2025834 RepID=UPI0035943E62